MSLISSLTLFRVGIFFMLYTLSADFDQNLFQKNSFRNTIRVSNSMDPNQDRRNVGPDLDQNCLKRLSGSVDDKSHLARKTSIFHLYSEIYDRLTVRYWTDAINFLINVKMKNGSTVTQW